MKDLEKDLRLRRAISDLTLDKLILQEAARGKLLSPARRRRCIDHVREMLDDPSGACVACSGSTGRAAQGAVRGNDEEALTEDVIALAKQYGRYGYRR